MSDGQNQSTLPSVAQWQRDHPDAAAPAAAPAFVLPDDAFKKGVALGLIGARVIADRHGATAVARDIETELARWFPSPAADGEAEYRSWMAEIELQSWEDAA